MLNRIRRGIKALQEDEIEVLLPAATEMQQPKATTALI
jgi:hypothetical protein